MSTTKLIYVGPTIEGLRQSATYTGGLPASQSYLLEKYPEINILLVPLTASATTIAAIKISGTPENAAFNKLSGGGSQKDPERSGGESIPRPSAGPVDVELLRAATSGNGPQPVMSIWHSQFAGQAQAEQYFSSLAK
ncbi:hypothetical protein [Paenibacillus gorillae]|uniref:hypothetical protein n=1 Tax=Paenibacillus gorillae TaxID=1243662 RepID=UPI0004B00F41|nr:hypothetical protein [Paenibacillus gorillae]